MDAALATARSVYPNLHVFLSDTYYNYRARHWRSLPSGDWSVLSPWPSNPQRSTFNIWNLTHDNVNVTVAEIRRRPTASRVALIHSLLVHKVVTRRSMNPIVFTFSANFTSSEATNIGATHFPARFFASVSGKKYSPLSFSSLALLYCVYWIWIATWEHVSPLLLFTWLHRAISNHTFNSLFFLILLSTQ